MTKATTALGSNPHAAANAKRGLPRNTSDTRFAHAARCLISTTSVSSLFPRFNTRSALGSLYDAPNRLAIALCDTLTCVKRAQREMSPRVSHALWDRSKVSRHRCASRPSTLETQLWAKLKCAKRMHPPSPAMAISEL